MKPGRSGAVIGSLPSDAAKSKHRLVGLVARRQRADHFDQLHQRHGIEEVQAAEPIRPLRRRRQLGDAQRRGVRDEDRVRPDDLLERRVGLPLVVEVLDDRLDDEVAVLQALERRRAARGSPSVVSRVPAATLPLPRLVQELLDPADALVERDVVDLADDRLVAGRRADLRDTGSHQPAAEHANRFDFHHATSTIAAIPWPPPMQAVGKPTLLPAAPQFQEHGQHQPRAASCRAGARARSRRRSRSPCRGRARAPSPPRDTARRTLR